MARDGLATEPEGVALLTAIHDAGDRAERLRGELTLAIHLLDRNSALMMRQRRAVFESRARPSGSSLS